MKQQAAAETNMRIVPTVNHLPQRRCACGQHTLGGGECEGCRNKQQKSQRRSTDQGESSIAPLAVAHSAGRSVGAITQPSTGSLFNRDFSRVRVYTGARAAGTADGAHDDPIHQPLIEQSRSRENLLSGGITESGPQRGPSEGQIKYTGLALPCPARTQVDAATDLTPRGLAAGFLSAYGVMVRMRVLPDARTWDGIRIVELLTPGTSTCPTGLTRPGPCTGGSTFTVGSPSGGSRVLGRQPGLINRFYDFHTSRSESTSFLHDSTRNPASMNSCQAVCHQEYLCDGAVIGRHTVTRTLRKGTHNGRDVTIIDVTKT